MNQQVNLYLAQYPPAKKFRLPFKYVLLLTLLLGGGIAGGSLGYLEIEAKKEQLAVEKSLLDSATKNVQKLKNLQRNSTGDRIKLELIALQDAIKRKSAMANSINKQINFTAKGFSERYIALARQDVRGIWLNSIEFDVDRAKVTLRGGTLSAALLTDYLDQLSKEPSFNGVSFKVLSLDESVSNSNEVNRFMDFVVSTHELSDKVDLLRASLRQ